jgi:hypothetical protein
VEGEAGSGVWSDRIILAARKALKDVRADDSLHHAALIKDLEVLIGRISERRSSAEADDR